MFPVRPLGVEFSAFVIFIYLSLQSESQFVPASVGATDAAAPTHSSFTTADIASGSSVVA
jgi:hypothetical protein